MQPLVISTGNVETIWPFALDATHTSHTASGEQIYIFEKLINHTKEIMSVKEPVYMIPILVICINFSFEFLV